MDEEPGELQSVNAKSWTQLATEHAFIYVYVCEYIYIYI